MTRFYWWLGRISALVFVLVLVFLAAYFGGAGGAFGGTRLPANPATQCHNVRYPTGEYHWQCSP